jgi:predicted RNase H-like nuclease
MRVLGLDGCPGGWAGALLAGDAVTLRRYEGWGAGLQQALDEDVDLVAVDIPVGLPDPGVARDCDRAARAVLGRRGASVFPAPPRELLGFASHAAASAASRAAYGRGISVQAWNIYGRIAAVDALATPQLQARLLEVHPEVAFWQLAGTDLGSKHTVAGRAARAAALRADLPGLPDDGALARRGTARDDVLDALACAWTGRRWLAGRALLVPAQPPRDAHGLWMGIAA